MHVWKIRVSLKTFYIWEQVLLGSSLLSRRLLFGFNTALLVFILCRSTLQSSGRLSSYTCHSLDVYMHQAKHYIRTAVLSISVCSIWLNSKALIWLCCLFHCEQDSPKLLAVQSSWPSHAFCNKPLHPWCRPLGPSLEQHRLVESIARWSGLCSICWKKKIMRKMFSNIFQIIISYNISRSFSILVQQKWNICPKQDEFDEIHIVQEGSIGKVQVVFNFTCVISKHKLHIDIPITRLTEAKTWHIYVIPCVLKRCFPLDPW